MSTPIDPAESRLARRKRLLVALASAIVLVGVGYGLYWFITQRHYESTDNAYVGGNLVQITPQVTGTVVAIYADDTDFVKAGQPLVKLDATDARIALDQAQAQLGQTVREVRTLFANNLALQAQVALRETDVVRARSEVERAREDVNRRQELAPRGAVSGEELSHVVTALANAGSSLSAAEASVVAAREQLAANRALTEGTTVEEHPSVQRAAARVREAYLAVSRAELPAPVSGYVAKRSVQVGGRVQAGAPLMTVIPLDQLWVDANFKESQLRGMRIGQPAEVTADVYGGKVTYHGKVEGLSAGTGAAFALLPAQNATGNWIKVVQRVPVRIALDPKELAEHPLRVGLSTEARVDISDQSGKSLADAPPTRAVAQTAVFDAHSTAADAIVRKIIAANLAGATSKAVDAMAAPTPARTQRTPATDASARVGR
jgi:membrane fusion protein, multidrug efflux system